jgi:uncharacterized coiled-coil protein SlyX
MLAEGATSASVYSRVRPCRRNILRIRVFSLCSALEILYSTRMQSNGNQLGLLEPSSDIRENGIHLEDRDALLDAKDQTIAELKEQVAFLRCELERKDEIMLRMAERTGDMIPAAPALEAPGGSEKITCEAGRDGDRARDAWEEQEEPKRPTLPGGYRVVAFASDAWVLIAPRGVRVAAYRGQLDFQKVAVDARNHHQSGE